DVDLEVEMVTGGVPGEAAEAEDLTLRDLLADRDRDLREVGVQRLHAVRVADNDVVAVGTAGVTAGEGDGTGSRGADRRVRVAEEVDGDAQRVRRTEVAGDRAGSRPDEAAARAADVAAGTTAGAGAGARTAAAAAARRAGGLRSRGRGRSRRLEAR